MRSLFLFCFALLFTFSLSGCSSALSLVSQSSEDGSFSFVPSDFNYFEQHPPSPDFQEDTLSLLLQFQSTQNGQQIKMARAGCQGIFFHFDQDFYIEGDEIPCSLQGSLEIRKHQTKLSTGSGIANSRIAFFLLEEETQKIVNRTILDQVVSFEEQEESSPFHQKLRTFRTSLKLKPFTSYTFYFEVLGRVDLFSPGQGQVETECILHFIRIQEKF